MSFFGNLEEFAADLYPYRWPITIGLVLALVAFVAIAYYRGWHLIVLRYKLASALVAVAFLVVTVPLGNYLLSPLWERSYLEEASPLAAAPAPPGSTAQPGAVPTDERGGTSGAPAFEARVVRNGVFSGADDFHFGEGRALLIETAPGRFTLRFEEFSVRNGPDLFVYLTPDKDSVEGAINLGELKATDGAFNYEVPAGTDVAQVQYAIVWCRQFEVLFASALLGDG